MSAVGTTEAAAVVGRLVGARRAGSDATLELGFRFAAVQVGYWLGWASIAVVLAGLALDAGARHRSLLPRLTLAAPAANSAAMGSPWRESLAARRRRLLLSLW